MSSSFTKSAAFRTTVLLGALALSMGAALARDVKDTVKVGALTRTFSVHVPDVPLPANGFPVIIAFHGGGMQGRGMAVLTRLNEVADRKTFVVVYPDGIDRHWNDGRSTIKNPQDDVAFASRMIEKLVQTYHVDGRRIFATGASNGALFTERLGCDLATSVAGIAPVAGSMPVDLARACHPSRDIAVLQIDGTADPIMPYTGGAVANFGGKGEGGDVQSVLATVAGWAERNHCGAPEPTQILPTLVPTDPTRASRTDYSRCPATGRVSMITITGGGHTWPGGPQYARRLVVGLASQQLDASSVIADFFLALPVRNP